MRRVLWFLPALVLACGERPRASDAGGPGSKAPARPTPAHAAEPPAAAPSAAAPAPALSVLAPAPHHTLPAELALHAPVDVVVPLDKPLRVTHAGAEIAHAIVYLQGMCSDAKSADVWFEEASKHGTVIALRPDVPCMPERPGFKWPAEPGLIEARLERALELVKEQRGGQLDARVLTLVGYSQGSGRAELLASRSPERYRHVVLGGHPGPVFVPHFQPPQRVAFLGGDQEKTDDMRASDLALQAAGVDSRFFLLPHSYHGTYGPEGQRVMSEVLQWLER